MPTVLFATERWGGRLRAELARLHQPTLTRRREDHFPEPNVDVSC
jgi:hypothetical protein